MEMQADGGANETFELGELWEGLLERERKLLDGTGFPLNDESCAR